MPPLAQLVFLTPRAALVGITFAAPLIVLGIRERAHSRARSMLDLRRPRGARVLTRPVGIVALAALVAATAAQPAVRATDSTPGALRRGAVSSRSTSAARCWPRAHPVGPCEWSAREPSGETSTPRSATSRPASQR